MTKNKPSSMPKTLIDANRINLDTTEKVERTELKKKLIGN